MANQRGFASDNYAGVHPEVMARMAEVNQGHQVAYGDDTETARFQEIVKELFGKNAVGFPVFNHLTLVRPIDFGLAIGVLIDAFLVRLILVPAVMSLLGKSAWWLPKWLDKILPNVDGEGSSLEREKDKTLVR